MVFNPFALGLTIRVVLLVAILTGLSAAIANEGYYAMTLLLSILGLLVFFNLYQFVGKSNDELSRFLEAARSGDFSQSFRASGFGAEFDKLGEKFEDIMAQLKSSQESQEIKLHHLSLLTEQIPVPLFSIYPNGKVKLYNNAARQFFADTSVHTVEDLKSFGQEFFDTLTNLLPGNPCLINFTHDQVARQVTVIMSQIVTGDISENLISMQDIQSELDSAQSQAWQDLVRVLTHEIMNSVTPVASLANTATDLVKDTQQKLSDNDLASAIEGLNDVRRATDTVAKRSLGLSDFVQNYRSLTSMPEPQKQLIDVKDIFRRALSLYSAQWQQRDIRLETSIQPESLQINADPDLIDQVLINLLQNAEQALTKVDAATQPKVTLNARFNQRGYVLIEVADNGPGVPEDICDEIFMPFYTTKQKGSGVGLALTRQIMIAHGGNISLKKSDKGGAEFTLIF